MFMSLYDLQKIHKINDNIPSTINDNLIEHIPIQKCDTRKHQTSGNHPRVRRSGLKQAKYHIWRICTSLYRHH